MKKKLLVLFLVLAASLSAGAKVVMPQMFQSGMVLQRGKPIPVWGTADAGERVLVSWCGKQYATTADASGRWRVDLPKMKAGGPYILEVRGEKLEVSGEKLEVSGEGSEVTRLTDVLVGDVWLCSGQSNMDVTIERVYPQYPDEIDRFDNARIRLLRVPNTTDTHGVRNDIMPTQWKTLTKEHAWQFSALGTFLGLRMFRETGVPQGIIVNSWGGTPIEAWISADSLRRDYPMMVERTRLYQDDDYVAAQQQANQRAADRWFQLLNERDAFPADDAGWPAINQYDLAAHLQPLATHGNYLGSVWLRQHVHIDKQHAGRPARFLLGTLFDQDYTYVNGQEVGRTYYQYPPRRYQIPEGLLREGDNVITVRFVNKYGIPHFIKEKPYMMIFSPGDTLRLSEQWLVGRGALMPSCPSADVSLQNLPTTLYNAVLHPLAPYALSGVVWYQGESNTGNPAPYADLLRKMMGNWRTLWNDPSMPFCIVQLANYMEPSDQPQESGWPQLREAQRLVAANDPHAELAVAIDLGETVDIHPLRKREVAERVGLCMDKLMGRKAVVLSPQLLRSDVEGSTVRLVFDQPLRTADVCEFELAGADGRFVNAEAHAEGNRVEVRSEVAQPVRVRYAWKNNPIRANLYGQNGLPASPFEHFLTPAEDGHQLWLRYPRVNKAKVVTSAKSPTIELARRELEAYYDGPRVELRLDASMPDDDGYSIDGQLIRARRDVGLLYGAYALLRGERGESHPAFALRMLNHWDNLDGTIERGYAGKSIFWQENNSQFSVLSSQLIKDYARANASIGINGTVLNNVNASPKMLTTPYLKQVRQIADLLRPYGIRVFLSINFATPMALGETTTADPLDASVARWWQRKAQEIYKLIPDFGGFLVKANSEGQPGPGDYHRSHADGANMLADALASASPNTQHPSPGLVIWRCFVYGANHKGEDRVKQAVSEFKPLDGQFRPNVILQTKNGPLDFQPREPYSPVFDQIKQTPNMVELQITQEYLGQSRHLVYLAPMWKEFFQHLSPNTHHLHGISGVANIGLDRNWCGHHFSQANWYAFGRLAWNPDLSSEAIAQEWLRQTFDADEQFMTAVSQMMMESREACVDYMMPLGLHHIFKFDHHYGPEPDGFKADYPLEWCPVYYHKANKDSIGFDRSHTGTDATSQYRPEYARLYDNIETCPENLLLWFHRVPWTYRMKDGSTLWQSMQRHYRQGVATVERHHDLWHNKLRYHVDEQRWREVDERLEDQLQNAREWRDVCLRYFGSFANQK